MPWTCSKCSRVNPDDAEYCYYDGIFLKGQSAVASGPINMATRPFPSPFVFPSGRTCGNFDELALGCHQEWPAALEMLAHGDLASFLSGMGRMDLARAARESAQTPDRDRGLDDLLAKFPGAVLEPPKLVVEPAEFHVGQLRLGEDRTLSLRLVNQGKRLLYGHIQCKDAVWLSLGESAATQQKLFEFAADLHMPVHIQGKRLSARPYPLEGRLVIESNGGTVTVVVRVTVPVQPFAAGVLAGAVSPRQLAEKAKGKPKEAAIFFENGTVARWYAANGWDYPVKGDVTSGAAVIQQYFEAHGLAKPPRVELSPTQIYVQGRPGQQLRLQLEVRTLEKKHVYALASTSQPWLKVEPTPPRGQSATVHLIAQVPDVPGETLQARVRVRANGNQTFLVPVAIAVVSPRRSELDTVPRTVPPAVPAVTVSPPPRVIEPPSLQEPAATDSPFRWSLHLLPAALLLAVLLGMGFHDYTLSPSPQLPSDVAEEVDRNPLLALRMHHEADKELGQPTMRFGLTMTRETDPQNPQRPKRLTYFERGQSNNTCVRIDGADFLFGSPEKIHYEPARQAYVVLREGLERRHLGGRWKKASIPLGDAKGRRRDGFRSVWQYEENVVVTQTVEIVPGQVSRKLDTCLVLYKLENVDKRSHTVGLRFMLDTYIGANDGVPFTLPGAKGLCDTMHDFRTADEVPDFIQALERESLADPGTIANVQLRLGGRIEPPQRVTLGAWPDVDLQTMYKTEPFSHLFNQHRTLWEVPVVSMQSKREFNAKFPADSTVVMYWPEQELKAGASREVGFAYGLGNVAGAGGQLGVSVGGALVVGGDFTVTALVHDPRPGQQVALHLPAGLQLLQGAAEQLVPALPDQAVSKNSPVSWKVRASRRGPFEITVTSGSVTQTLKLTISERRVFD